MEGGLLDGLLVVKLYAQPKQNTATLSLFSYCNVESLYLCSPVFSGHPPSYFCALLYPNIG